MDTIEVTREIRVRNDAIDDRFGPRIVPFGYNSFRYWIILELHVFWFARCLFRAWWLNQFVIEGQVTRNDRSFEHWKMNWMRISIIVIRFSIHISMMIISIIDFEYVLPLFLVSSLVSYCFFIDLFLEMGNYQF